MGQNSWPLFWATILGNPIVLEPEWTTVTSVTMVSPAPGTAARVTTQDDLSSQKDCGGASDSPAP